MEIDGILNIGERVEFNIADDAYRTIVEDIPTPSSILVAQVTKNGLPVYIQKGTIVDVYFTRQDAMYAFPARISDRRSEGNIRMHLIEAIGPPERNQRRESYRLPVSCPSEIWIYQEVLGGELDTFKISAFTVDISETGMQINSHELLDAGSVVNCDVALDGIHKIHVKGEVLRDVPPPAAGQPRRIGLRFIDISERVQKVLLRFILQEQVKDKRR